VDYCHNEFHLQYLKIMSYDSFNLSYDTFRALSYDSIVLRHDNYTISHLRMVLLEALAARSAILRQRVAGWRSPNTSDCGLHYQWFPEKAIVIEGRVGGKSRKEGTRNPVLSEELAAEKVTAVVAVASNFPSDVMTAIKEAAVKVCASNAINSTSAIPYLRCMSFEIGGPIQYTTFYQCALSAEQ
jgi:hypothetical protein